jgi:hypothetical protein
MDGLGLVKPLQFQSGHGRDPEIFPIQQGRRSAGGPSRPELYPRRPFDCPRGMAHDIRWEQRLQNLTKAYRFLKAALDQEQLSPLERTGVIQAYEFTFELARNTLKDYLNGQGVEASFPRDVLKKAFEYALLDDGEV